MVMAGWLAACDGTPTELDSLSQAAETADADGSVVVGDFTDGLGLTDEQAAAVREIVEAYRDQGREPGALWAAAAELQGILTSEQIAAIEERVSQKRSEMRTRARRGDPSGGERARGNRGDRGDVIPDLTDEQSAQLEAIRESYGPQMREIREAVRDGSLSQEEARARMQDLRDAMHAEVSAILTEEQLAALEAHRAEAEARREEAGDRREQNRDEWQDRREAAHEAMVEALGLSSDQVAALEALRESTRGEGRPSSAEEAEQRREAHREALWQILDDEQQEIWILHDSLRQMGSRQGAGQRAGRGARGARGA
jgi:Spy/CpxP family protein refolding chaperone